MFAQLDLPMAEAAAKLLALRAGTAVRGFRSDHVSTESADPVALNRGHRFEVRAFNTVWTALLLHRSPEPLFLPVANSTQCPR